MRPPPGEVLHFSEDPTITRFEPHLAATAQVSTPYVWAVDADRSPDYWFPRQCPRAMAWVVPTTTPADRLLLLGPGGGERVHAIEYGWLGSMTSVQLWAYRLPAETFSWVAEGPGEPAAVVSPTAVEPLGPPVAVGNLLDLHEQAGIQLRVLPNLWPFWDAVIQTTLGFSGIRLRNARRRPGPDASAAWSDGS